MSLSSLQSAFDGGDYLTDGFGGSRTQCVPCRIHSTLRDRDKNAMPCQGILLGSRAQRADDIDGEDLLIYGAPPRLTQVKSGDDVS
jgi:hypothetical protein